MHPNQQSYKEDLPTRLNLAEINRPGKHHYDPTKWCKLEPNPIHKLVKHESKD